MPAATRATHLCFSLPCALQADQETEAGVPRLFESGRHSGRRGEASRLVSVPLPGAAGRSQRCLFFLWSCLFRLCYTVQLIRMRDVPCPCGSSRPRIECCYAFQSRVSPRQCCGTVPHSTCMPFCPSADCRTADVGLSLLFSTDQHKQGRVCTCADDAPMRPFCGMCHCSISTYSGEGRPKGS